VRTFAGTDGGLFDATNVFTAAPGAESSIDWRNDNEGLQTSLAWAVASTDPSPGQGGGDAFMSAAYDNAVIVAEGAGGMTNAFLFGGDGVGAAIHGGSGGIFYWGSDQDGRFTCSSAQGSCLLPASWKASNPTLPAGDQDVFFRAIVPVPSDPTGDTFLTHTTNNVWATNAQATWSAISGSHCAGTVCASGNIPNGIARVDASPNVAGLYGLVLNDNRFAVTSDGMSPVPHWTITPTPLGGGGAFDASASGIALPAGVPPGVQPGDEYMVTNRSPKTTVDHLFVTHDRGKTFTAIHGVDSCRALPHVPIDDARYDPTDTTNRTFYVATAVGVYRTADGGDHWARLGTGLPRVEVTQLFVAHDDNLVRVSTLGRGIWEIRPGH
jgi:hypothetical protein